MGKRGPKPKPEALRLFEGDPGKLLAKRKGAVKPPAVTKPPDPPSWLGTDGKAAWRELVPQLVAVGLFTKLDARALAQYCHWTEVFHLARRQLNKPEKYSTINPTSGAMKASHWMTVLSTAQAHIHRLAAEFGLSPSSRVGLKGNTATASNAAAAGDPLEMFKLPS